MIDAATIDGIRVLHLSRPERRNAMTPELLDVLCERVRESGTAGARALVLLGKGPVFCAGFDLAMCEADPTGGTMRRLLSGLSGVIRALRALPMPVVVGVQGAAIAGGCALLGGADLVLAERGARLGYPVVRLGVSPAVNAGGLHRGLGFGPARRLMLDPGLIDSGGARRVGLVHKLVDSAEEVERQAMARGAMLAAKPGRAVRATRDWLEEVGGSLGWGASGSADAGLAASIALTGGEEERRLLPTFRAPAKA